MAIRRLLQDGIDPESMEVMTSQPIHGEAFIPEKKPTKLRTWALCGAAAGLLGGLSLATITALNYPLVKGGMPIVSPWTVGLITYETTMLGAVLATLVRLAGGAAPSELQESSLRPERGGRRSRAGRLVRRQFAEHRWNRRSTRPGQLR